MGSNEDPRKSATAAEVKLRGRALEGSDQKESVDHTDYEETLDPDTEVRLDGEKDTLYDDGLDIGDLESDTDTLAGTRGTSSGIKP